jgi:hypothetical protein
MPFLALPQTHHPFGAPETEHSYVEPFAEMLAKLFDVLARETEDEV